MALFEEVKRLRANLCGPNFYPSNLGVEGEFFRALREEPNPVPHKWPYMGNTVVARNAAGGLTFVYLGDDGLGTVTAAPTPECADLSDRQIGWRYPTLLATGEERKGITFADEFGWKMRATRDPNEERFKFAPEKTVEHSFEEVVRSEMGCQKIGVTGPAHAEIQFCARLCTPKTHCRPAFVGLANTAPTRAASTRHAVYHFLIERRAV